MPVEKTFNVQIRVNKTFLPGYTNLISVLLFFYLLLAQNSSLAFTSSISHTGKCKFFITTETFPQLYLLSDANYLIT